MKMHTEEYKKMMSERKRQWWIRARKNPEVYKQICARIGIASSKRTMPSGKDHPLWKGGKFTQRGYHYKWVEDHPNAVRSGKRKSGAGHVMEHRLEMEKKLGRYLSKDEEVHHINGIKADNRIENLELVTKSTHFGKVKCPHCGSEFKIK